MRLQRVHWLCIAVLLFVARCQDKDTEPNLEDMPPPYDEQGDDADGATEDGPDGGELHTEVEDVYAPMQVTPEQMQALHLKIDENKDGQLSMPEIIAFSKATRKAIALRDSEAVLEDMDADKDGKVSRSEFYRTQVSAGSALPEGLSEEDEAHERKKIEEADNAEKMHQDLEMQKFQIADSNGDGFLVIEELPAALYPETHDGVLALTAQFSIKLRDKDEDGQLSQDEVWEIDPGEEDSIQEEARKEQADVFKKLDKDKNGRLSLDEVKAWESGAFHTSEGMQQLFEVADKDKDQHITMDELKSSQEHLKDSEDVNSHLLEWAEHHEIPPIGVKHHEL